MTFRELVPVGVLGQRIRNGFVAGGLFACTWAAWLSVRNPVWDDAWDAYNSPQLFLSAPSLFFLGAAIWQLICLIAESFYGKIKRETKTSNREGWQDTQWTLKFWLRDSLRICVFYVTTGLIGDIPMAVNYLAEIRGWPLHLLWSNAVISCLLLMIAVWWVLERTYKSHSA
jgi:hypothetical protein